LAEDYFLFVFLPTRFKLNQEITSIFYFWYKRGQDKKNTEWTFLDI